MTRPGTWRSSNTRASPHSPRPLAVADQTRALEPPSKPVIHSLGPATRSLQDPWCHADRAPTAPVAVKQRRRPACVTPQAAKDPTSPGRLGELPSGQLRAAWSGFGACGLGNLHRVRGSTLEALWRDDHSGTINLTVADADSPPAELTLSAASSNPALVPTGNIGFAGNGTARTMTVSAVDGRSGTATLTVTASDGQDSGTVKVTVTVGGGGGGKDTLTGDTGADLLLAQTNNDTLTGGDGNDLLCGDSGGDTLGGGGGDDSLGGGSGSDRLTGGSGADRFSGGSGTDTATDLTATEGDTNDGTIP
jgi:hypothetical protein